MAVHLLKLSWWRLHRLRRVRVLGGPPGSLRRYEAFYRIGGRQARRHAVIPFDGPTLLVRAGRGDPPLLWRATDRTTTVTISADHIGVVLAPAVSGTAAAISRWLEVEAAAESAVVPAASL
jgi:hypothetical protein